MPDTVMQEWVVADRMGGFAMGTPHGLRARKYHGFYLGIPGRDECSWVTDLSIELNGAGLWPHVYRGPEGPVVHPDPSEVSRSFEAAPVPTWKWKTPEGELAFSIDPLEKGGMKLAWQWVASGKTARPKRAFELKVRLFLGFRDLHSVGGRKWRWSGLSSGRARALADPGEDALELKLQGKWSWQDSPDWYRDFHYTEEVERGYAADEDLFSAGVLKLALGAKSQAAILVSDNEEALRKAQPARRPKLAPSPGNAILDFVLRDPPGVTAGFPWFGEWGRDTFVSLPGIVAGWSRLAGSSKEAASWATSVLERWGAWIDHAGMIPNVIERDGSHQWESADGTLWWCHALAGLWAFSLVAENVKHLADLPGVFHPMLRNAIESISSGRHLFLRLGGDGLLEVTEPHATWMDARIDGAPVSGRRGALPEINALWFQARLLDSLWSGERGLPRSLEELAVRALGCQEPDRPNRVFLHSIPLAPSFALGAQEALRQDLNGIAQSLWTPVGLRTLAPSNPGYRPIVVGTQAERDRAYHQGAAWAWLGSHYEMARARLEGDPRSDLHLARRILDESTLATFPIPGHVPEIFDGDAPFVPRGAPAQAWSLACLEELNYRLRKRVDSRIRKRLPAGGNRIARYEQRTSA